MRPPPPYTTLGRLALILFAALFIAAQQGAATHAIAHVSEWLAGTAESDDESDSHRCPDCARFASVSDQASPCDSTPVRFERASALPSRATFSRCVDATLERPRIRGPPNP